MFNNFPGCVWMARFVKVAFRVALSGTPCPAPRHAHDTPFSGSAIMSLYACVPLFHGTLFAFSLSQLSFLYLISLSLSLSLSVSFSGFLSVFLFMYACSLSLSRARSSCSLSPSLELHTLSEALFRPPKMREIALWPSTNLSIPEFLRGKRNGFSTLCQPFYWYKSHNKYILFWNFRKSIQDFYK